MFLHTRLPYMAMCSTTLATAVASYIKQDAECFATGGPGDHCERATQVASLCERLTLKGSVR